MNFHDPKKQLDDLHGDLDDKKASGKDVNPVVYSFWEELKQILAGQKWQSLKIARNLITPFIPKPIVKIADGIGNQLKNDTMAKSKKATKSKTIITSIVVGIAGLLAIFGIIPEDAVSPDAGWVATAVAVVMFALRLVTKEPVQVSGK